MRAMLVSILACAGLAVFAVSASAYKPKQGKYSGKTSEGLKAEMRLGKEIRYPCPTPDNPGQLCGEKAKRPWVQFISFFAKCPEPSPGPDFEVGFRYNLDQEDGVIEPPASVTYGANDPHASRRTLHPSFFMSFKSFEYYQLSEDPDDIESATLSGYVGGRWKSSRTVRGSVNVELDWDRPDLPDCNVKSRWKLRRR